MRLISGKTFNLNDYWDNDFNIKDIAYALSKQCRWGGHTMTWFSIAEHSVRVALRVKDWPKHALLHDASEYIYPDLPSPLAIKVPGYVKESKELQRAINKHFGLNYLMPEEVHQADLEIREWEFHNYVIKRNQGWSSDYARGMFFIMAQRVGIRISA